MAARRGERGASAVEFGLVMLPLLYLVLGIIQYGVYFWSMNSGSNAVGDAVRRMAVGDCQTSLERKHFLHVRLGEATTSKESEISTTVVYLKPDGSTGTGLVIGGKTEGATPGVFSLKRELADLQSLLGTEETRATGLASELQTLEEELRAADNARITGSAA